MVRLTINLDEELYRVAKAQAELEHISISEAVNGLLRRGLESSGTARITSTADGFPLIVGGPALTAEDVGRVEADEGARLERLIVRKP